MSCYLKNQGFPVPDKMHMTEKIHMKWLCGSFQRTLMRLFLCERNYINEAGGLHFVLNINVDHQFWRAAFEDRTIFPHREITEKSGVNGVS